MLSGMCSSKPKKRISASLFGVAILSSTTMAGYVVTPSNTRTSPKSTSVLSCVCVRKYRRSGWPDPVLKNVLDEIAKPPAGLQQTHAKLIEVVVKIRAVARDLIVFFELRFDRLDPLHAHVRRITEDDIKPAPAKHLGEGPTPVECSGRKVNAAIHLIDQ